MYNWGTRSKTILSGVRHTTKSLVRWPIFTIMNDHSGANLEADFAINMLYGAVLSYLEAKKHFSSIIRWKESIMELFFFSCLAAQHTTLAQATLLTTVKQPNLLPSWSRCWPRKAWSWSTDTIQTPVGLIHIHITHNWGPRPKVVLSDAGDATKSMVMWLILTRIWMTILELIWRRLCNEYAT